MTTGPPLSRAAPTKTSTRNESAELDIKIQAILCPLKQYIAKVERDKIQRRCQAKIDKRNQKLQMKLKVCLLKLTTHVSL